MKSYQVVGDCAHVTVDSPAGPVSVLLYRPAMLPPGVPQERINHLLSVKLIAEVAGSAPAESGEVPDPEVEKTRTGAKAKLPADGSAPHPNAGKDVWVEYAVAKGMDRAEADKVEKADLIAALKS